jgi:hypothetical protein
MKKTFLFVALFMALFCTGAYADWIGMEYEIEGGWSPFGGFGGYETAQNKFLTIDGNTYSLYSFDQEEWNVFYLELSTRVWLWEHIFIGGSVTTLMSFVGEKSFNPYFSNYMFESGVKFGSLELFYSHDCTHPVTPYAYSYRLTSLWGEGGVDRIGFRLKGELK